MLLSSNSTHASGIKGRPWPKPPKPPNPRCETRAATGSDAGLGIQGRSSDAVAHFAPQDTGRPTSGLTPLRDGPRQCGQFSAAAALTSSRSMNVSVAKVRITLGTSSGLVGFRCNVRLRCFNPDGYRSYVPVRLNYLIEKGAGRANTGNPSSFKHPKFLTSPAALLRGRGLLAGGDLSHSYRFISPCRPPSPCRCCHSQ